MKRALILLTLCLFATGVAFAEPTGDAKALNVRTFQFKYKDADRAAAIIKPLMSAEGSMSIQPASNALVVTDRADNMKAIANALGDFDTPPHAVKLSLHLVGAGRSETATKVEPGLREIAGKLAILRYNAIDNLGDANVVAVGRNTIADDTFAHLAIGEGLDHFVLQRHAPDPAVWLDGHPLLLK